MKRLLPFFAAFLLLLSRPALGWNHSEIKWKSVETEHFIVHYNEGAADCAADAARIAEQSYGPITRFYNYEPSRKVHIILSDKEDVSSGETYFYLDKIEITATYMDFIFRGSTNWLENVITHEFTHIVTIQKAMKYPLRVPSLYVQVVSFEREKRPDVIIGYPNFQASYPIPGEVVPNWFAEGVAQFQSPEGRYDFWDSHRDMLLRVAVLSGGLLTLDEMGVFGKNSLGNELVYNQGFSMVRYIAERFGLDKLDELVAALSRPYRMTFYGACKSAIHMSDKELYREWKKDLESRYGVVAAGIEKSKVDGRLIAGNGFVNIYPVSDDRGGYFFLSNKGSSFLRMSLVHLKGNGKGERIAEHVTSQFSISPDGSRICYSKLTDENPYHYRLNDLFIYDMAAKKERRLTRGARAVSPAWSPDASKVACIVGCGCSRRIAIVDVSTGEMRYITELSRGTEYFGLSWGQGGILTSVLNGHSRDIALVNPANGTVERLVSTPADERDPVWDIDGGGFFYSCDRTGIFNIYHRSIGDSVDVMVTNCIGGAFTPSVSGSELVFSGYASSGYTVRAIDDWREVSRPMDSSNDDEELMRQRKEVVNTVEAFYFAKGPAAGRSMVGHDAGSSDSFSAGVESKKGSSVGASPVSRGGFDYTMIYLFPRFLIYEGKARLGLFASSGEILGRQSFSAGGSINLDREFDANLAFEMRQFKPTFLFEFYRSRKYYSYVSEVETGENTEYYTRYDLWDVYFHTILEFGEPSLVKRNELDIRLNHGEYGLNVEIWDLMKQREFRGEVGWNYYKSNELSLVYRYKSVRPELDADINPRGGRKIVVEVTKAFDKLHSGEFEFMFRPIYRDNDFGRYIVDYEEFVPMPFHSTFSLRLSGGAIDNNVDDFFYMYIGSRDRLRGYSYYSLGGRKFALARARLTFPLLMHFNRQLFNVYLSSVYASVFAEAGKAWDEDNFDLRGNKKDVGFELRAKGFSFYSFPLAVSVEGAYGLNDVEFNDPFDEFKTFYEGKKWKFYGSVLFSF